MLLADKWKDYELIDASCGEKLERWGNVYLLRPDPQIIWNNGKLIDKYRILKKWDLNILDCFLSKLLIGIL